MVFFNEPWMHDLFDPLDFSGVSRYPNQFHGNDWKKCIPKFHRHKDSVEWHIISFMGAISKLNVVHEDVKMNKFQVSLDSFNIDVEN